MSKQFLDDLEDRFNGSYTEGSWYVEQMNEMGKVTIATYPNTIFPGEAFSSGRTSRAKFI